MIHNKATIRNTANSESGPQAGARLKHSGCRWPCNRRTGIWTYCGLTTHGHLIMATVRPMSASHHLQQKAESVASGKITSAK
ncbi:hypothetical protein TsFJ059_006465 [Trichoderma semiorbis]|uniref:Uncharacterized protein n=1 Tax=Trichoderma semiorbis TaxID=1491008 RepID=A0A9P8HCR9_9HYPO|nr:hypothetical protein TsFJ059_006465 [Trichoderma semiorbis]